MLSSHGDWYKTLLHSDAATELTRATRASSGWVQFEMIIPTNSAIPNTALPGDSPREELAGESGETDIVSGGLWW